MSFFMSIFYFNYLYIVDMKDLLFSASIVTNVLFLSNLIYYKYRSSAVINSGHMQFTERY